MFKGLSRYYTFILMLLLVLAVELFFFTVTATSFAIYENAEKNNLLWLMNECIDEEGNVSVPAQFNENNPFRCDPNSCDIKLERINAIIPRVSILSRENESITRCYGTFREGFDDRSLAEQMLMKGRHGKVQFDNTTFLFSVKKIKNGTEFVAFYDIESICSILKIMHTGFVILLAPLFCVIYFFGNRITEKMKNHLQLSIDKQKMLIADISHELKTPVSAIGANVDVLLGDCTKDQKKWLSYIKKENSRMSELVNDMLYLSKIESLSRIENMEAVNLSQMLDTVLLTFESAIIEGEKQFIRNVGTNIIIQAVADEVYKLLSILIDNAIKYSDTMVYVDLCMQQHSVKLTVTNDGETISPNDLQFVFERFFRGDKFRSNSEGFGLGLSIAKSIVEQYDGKISAESKEGKTTFIVVLPLR